MVKKREKKKLKARDGSLDNFVRNHNLDYHLSKQNGMAKCISYSSIKRFEQDMKKLASSQVLINLSGEMKKYETVINEIFDYKTFTKFNKNRNRWDAYTYTELLDMQVCPYCDRQFIQTFVIGDAKARAVLDHFYSKSLYPYLATSIFNLIPCCHQCNSTFKHNTDLYLEEIIYPFEEEFKNNVTFEINYKHYNALIGFNADLEIILKVDPTSPIKEKIEKSIKLFKLPEVYSGHHLYVKSLIRKIYLYNSSMIKQLY